MLYKPKYCCHCGEKIERASWSFRSSRRFCEVCETDFVLQDWLPRIFAGLMTLMGIWGFGVWLQKSDKPEIVQTRQKLTPAAKTSKGSDNSSAGTEVRANANSHSPVQTGAANEINAAGRSAAQPGLTAKTSIRRGDSSTTDVVYYCGAETKKGNPCSRRVKGGGRCWQHTGQAAMLPREQLLIEQ